MQIEIGNNLFGILIVVAGFLMVVVVWIYASLLLTMMIVSIIEKLKGK